MLRLLFPSILFFLPLSAGNGRAAERQFDPKVQSFFQEHCLRCHGDKREEGGVRVDELSWDLDDLSSVNHIQNILDEIMVESMPPQGEPRPTQQSLEEVTSLLSKHIAAAKERYSSGGGKPVRRLTATEYVNTLYDLLGVRVEADELPEDGTAGSFDTEATELFTTDMHLERYLVAARIAVRHFIASRHEKPGRKKLEPIPSPSPTKRGIPVRVSDIPSAGYQIVRVVCWQKTANSKAQVFVGTPENPIYELTGTSDSPQHIDRVFYESTREYWKKNPELVIDRIENYQVVNPQPYEFFHERLKPYGDRVPDSAAADLIRDFVVLINRGRRVDRKLVSDLLTVFSLGRQQGETFWEAIVEPMAISLCTIEAMFHFETRGGPTKSRYVTPVEMVNRASYFLWRSAPDAELIRLAQSKEWYNPLVRKQQFRRMVQDKKFERFLRDFTVQWLELDRQDGIAVDERLFHKFNRNVKDSMKEETIQFVSHVIRNNLSLDNLIDSDFMLVNNLMAQHYGIEGVRGNEFRVMPVPNGSKRGGILTQAGILMQTGTGDRTSLVERGVFVLRKLLNDPPGIPPPLVDELPSTGKAVKTMTSAQIVAMHRQARQCASCHNKIDPIGAGLEELDAVGLFRTVDTRLNPDFDKLNRRQRKNLEMRTFKVPLESEGRVLGRHFQGVEGLKQALVSNNASVAEAYIEALLSMANGRKSGVADKEIVQAILSRAKSADLPALSILVAVLVSDAFKTH